MPKIYNFQNLLLAFNKAKINKKNKKVIYIFESNLYNNLLKIQSDLIDTYIPDIYNVFKINERKERIIYAPSFRDLITQHAIYQIIYPIINNKLIYHNYGCRKGKGIQYLRNYIMNKIQNTEYNYYLQCDIKKYFYSISILKLKYLLMNIFKESKLVELLIKFSINNLNNDCSDSYIKNLYGIPLGNLISQLMGVYYLNPLDQYIKHTLKIKYYARYMDDFILFTKTKDEAKILKDKIINFISVNLELKLSKYKINKIDNGIKLTGYKIARYKCITLKSNYNNFKLNIKLDNKNSLISQLAMSLGTNSQIQYQNLLLNDYKIYN